MSFKEKDYWNNRYSANGNSGQGSYGESAYNKARYINSLINKHNVKSICELGCGDGNQLSMFTGYDIYYGYDISDVIIKKNQKRFKDDPFKLFVSNIEDLPNSKHDLALSLDVLYHLVNYDVFEAYLKNLFNLSDLICIYAVDKDANSAVPHGNPRAFTGYIKRNFPEFSLEDESYREDSRLGFWTYKREA